MKTKFYILISSFVFFMFFCISSKVFAVTYDFSNIANINTNIYTVIKDTNDNYFLIVADNSACNTFFYEDRGGYRSTGLILSEPNGDWNRIGSNTVYKLNSNGSIDWFGQYNYNHINGLGDVKEVLLSSIDIVQNSNGSVFFQRRPSLTFNTSKLEGEQDWAEMNKDITTMATQQITKIILVAIAVLIGLVISLVALKKGLQMLVTGLRHS